MTLRCHSRRGTISLASVFVVLALAALVAVVWNATRVVHRKLEAQTAADAAAHAAGVQAARGMNQIAAINHGIGELLALAVLAHAPCGDELDGRAIEAPGDLVAAYRAAQLAPVAPDEVAFRKVSAPAARGGAIGAARGRLLGAFTDALRKHAADPPASLKTQAAVAAEWDTLDRLEAVARAELVPLRALCFDTLIPDLARHAHRVAEDTPARMEAAAAEVGRAHGAEVAYLPGGRPALPVVPDTEPIGDRSQIVRAAAPWVQYWRRPVLDFADRHLPLSQYAGYYRDSTSALTQTFARRLVAEKEVRLLVLADASGGASEDERFAHVWSATRPSAALFGRGVFRQPKPNGVAAVAQATLYNANPHDPDRPPPSPREASEWQPLIGRDTLNWDAAVPVPEYRFGLRRDEQRLVQQPRVKLNWRVRLAPVTRPLPPPYDLPVPTH